MGRHENWYQNLIMYCLDVETYADSNNDGVGDFQGLISRLDYLSALGITCLWLMPFYESPNRDDGYDVSNYTRIDPRYGDFGDFAEFMSEANARGLKVIIELIPNHTSIDHPWFEAACTDPTSKYHNYYVWRDDDPGDTSDKISYPGYQTGIWTFEPRANKWYLHHFYDFQADLNFSNPEVRAEFHKIMAFWLQLGVSGFRIDAAPFLIDLTGLDGVDAMEGPHAWLREMNEFARSRTGNAVLIGEVNVALSKLADYFGGGTELNALFNFPLSRQLLLALALESGNPISFGLSQLPTIPESGNWVNFVRNHDELNLTQLPTHEQMVLLEHFGPEPDMQIYERGIRRRLAPILDGDRNSTRLIFSALFSLPGCPVIFYGDEIGMGDDLALPQRLSFRTPMQWNAHTNAGFSGAPAKNLVRPVIDRGPFSYSTVNLACQRADPDSLVNWLAHLIRTRRECSELGASPWEVLKLESECVFAIAYTASTGTVVVLNNMANGRRTVSLDPAKFQAELAIDLFYDRPYPPLAETENSVALRPHGYRWLRFLPDGEAVNTPR